MYYLLVIAAVILGQSAWAAYQVQKHQASNDLINWPTAAKVYLRANFGSFVMVLTITLVILFVLSDWMNMNLTRAELLAKGELTKVEEIQAKFKTYAAVYGIFAQLIASLVYKGGENAIKNYGKQKGVDVDSNPK